MWYDCPVFCELESHLICLLYVTEGWWLVEATFSPFPHPSRPLLRAKASVFSLQTFFALVKKNAWFFIGSDLTFEFPPSLWTKKNWSTKICFLIKKTSWFCLSFAPVSVLFIPQMLRYLSDAPPPPTPPPLPSNSLIQRPRCITFRSLLHLRAPEIASGKDRDGDVPATLVYNFGCMSMTLCK